MLTQDFPPADGGIAIFVQHICQELGRNNINLEVLAQHLNLKETAAFDAEQSYTVHRFYGRWRASSLAPLMKTVFYGLKYNADVVFLGHMMSTYGIGAWLLWKIFRVPYVVLSHGFDLVEYWRQSRIDNYASYITLKDASLIIANSEYTKRIILERVDVAVDKIRVINPGVDPDAFRPGIDTLGVKNKYGFDDERILLTVSRLVPKKNHEHVLRALPIVLKKIPNLKYLIIGKGPERKRLESVVQQLGLQNQVIYTGPIEHADLPAYYSLCDLFIMPSCVVDDNFESFGIVFTEANACGKPVIGSMTGGITDAVIDGVTGLLVDPLDVSEIAKALLRLLNDPEFAKNLGKNGRKRVEKELTWQITVKRIVESLHSLRPAVKN